MKNTCYLLSLLVLLSAVSCKKSKYSNASWPIDATPVFSDGNIFISISERIDSMGKHFVLNCATEKIYPCANYSLTDTFVVKDNIVQIKFLGISKPGACLTALGPATAKIELDNLAPGIYDLLISGSGQSTGKLYVDAEQYRVSLQNTSGITFQNYSILRVPDNTIYGSMIYDPSQPSIVDTFLGALRNNGAQTAILRAGTYTDFIITADGTITEMENDVANLKWFIYHYTGAESSLQGTVQGFDRQKISIQLHAPSGRIYQN